MRGRRDPVTKNLATPSLPQPRHRLRAVTAVEFVRLVGVDGQPLVAAAGEIEPSQPAFVVPSVLLAVPTDERPVAMHRVEVGPPASPVQDLPPPHKLNTGPRSAH